VGHAVQVPDHEDATGVIAQIHAYDGRQGVSSPPVKVMTQCDDRYGNRRGTIMP
jgi:hypothetical protein